MNASQSSLFTLNPILMREARVRWRGNRAFVLSLIYTTVLALALLWRYQDFLSKSWYANADPLQRSAALGHDTFLMLTWMQTLGWMLLAPALTATAIAYERETGVLESVLLSRMTPWQVVAGKVWSAMSFIALLIIISLPITAVCFLLGGVSMGEFGAALALHLATAFTSATIGLAASAHYRRASTAMAMAFLFLVLWNIISGVACGVAATGITAAGLWWMPVWAAPFLELLGWTNPIIAAIDIASPFRSTNFGGMAGSTIETPAWIISVGGQLLFALTRLWQTSRELRRRHDDPEWLDAPRRKGKKSRKASTPGEEADNLPATRKQPPRRSWLELPLSSRLVFGNPLLQREARSKFRIRRPSRLIVVLFALPLATLLYLYGKLSLAALNDDYAREPLVIAIGIIYLMVTILMTAIMGSGALARERETGTWEGLLLSLLPVRSIIAAKVLAPVLACFSYSIIFWPLLALCITRWRFAGSRHNDVSLTQVLAGFLVILSTAWLCTAWGMLCSWYAKRSATATGWAVGSMLMAWIFFPVFLIWSFTSNSRGSGEAMLEIMRYWHPFIALVPIAEPTNFPSYRVERLSVLWDGFTSSAAFFFLGCLMLRVVYHGIRHESGLDRTPEQSP